jgi:hypothetical protein
MPFHLGSAGVSKGRFPFRGLVFSFVFHQVTMWSLLFFPSFGQTRRAPAEAGQLIAIDLNSPAKLIYFPGLKGQDEDRGEKKKGQPEPPKPADDEPQKTVQRSTKGLSFPGMQAIISDVPKPNNKFQTLLQPALENPPELTQPTPLPNIIQMTDAAPRPKPRMPAVQPTPETKLAEPAAPPEKKIELTAARKDLSIPAPPPVVAQRPKVVLPLTGSTEPEKPVEQVFAKKELAIPAVPQAPTQRANVSLLPNADTAVAAPVAPPEPEPPKPATQIASVPTEGPDARNLLAVSPLPAPPSPTVRVPAAEARGRFAVSPDANPTTPASTPGVNADKLPTAAAGAGANPRGNAPNDTPGRDTQPKTPDKNATANGTNSAGTPGAQPGAGKNSGSPDGTANGKDGAKSDSGTGTGAGKANGTGDTPAKSPFPGITIQGGRLETGTGVVGANSRSITIGAAPAPTTAANTSYSITITSTAGSGGGLPDLGVFAREQVYTVYIDMKNKTDVIARSWTLQYAFTQPTANQTGLVPPFPLVKDPPAFPPEVAKKYIGKMVNV